MRAVAADLTACTAGYALGSLPVGLWAARLARNIDVRDHGSGGTGTTNVLRTVGPGAAAAVFLLDVGKGAGAVSLARRLGCAPSGQAAAGVAAVVGHSWPVFARFRGGKGVATAFGALIPMSGTGAVSAVAGGVTSLAITRIVSVGSLAAATGATLGTAMAAVTRQGSPAAFGFAAVACSLVVHRHRANIERLLAGREPVISLRRTAA
jgi:glycerol-3-phosphate acyltransferase PlsY